MPRARGRALVGLCRALADGDVASTAAPTATRSARRLLALPGIGPWTADYVALRALGDPDVFLPTDIGVRAPLTGSGDDPAAAARASRALAALALLRADAPVGDPRPAGRRRHPDHGRRTDMWTSIDSPVGPLRVVAHHGAITAIEFDGPRRPGSRRARRSAAPRPARRPAGRRPRRRRPAARRGARASSTAYFDRELKEFDLPLAPGGHRLPAAGVGPAASRSATARPRRTARSPGRLGHDQRRPRARSGLANGRNPIPIVIPCHRVIGADGTLTGYAGGVERKQTLLELEQDALF